MMNMMACHIMAAMHIVATSIGTNLFNWLLGNLKPIVLGIVAISGVILITKKEITKLVAWFIISVLAIVMVFNTQGFADLLQNIGNTILGI